MESYQIYQRQANYNKADSTALFKQEIESKLSEASASELIQMYYKRSYGPGLKARTRWIDTESAMKVPQAWEEEEQAELRAPIVTPMG